jgi:hypothetical protein
MIRLPARRAILGVVSGVDPPGVSTAASRLAAAYRDVPGLDDWTISTLPLPAARAGVVVLAADAANLTAPTTLVWGLPLGAAGPVTDDEVRRVLADPPSVRELAGVFVLVRIDADAVRLLTSHDFVFTLRRSRDAFATRAVAALALAGSTPRIDPALVFQAVAWEGSVTTGELLVDVMGCDEGMLVEVNSTAVTTTDVAPLSERMAEREPLTPVTFRKLVGAETLRAARVDGARLALTEGRDSILAASCLAETGATMPTYTLGYRGYPDRRGAHAAARALGWRHDTIGVRDARGRRIARGSEPTADCVEGDLVEWLLRYAAWGEGLQSARDALVGHVAWRGSPFVSVTGHGGETGRAFYRLKRPDQDPADAIAVTGAGANLPETGQTRFREQIQAEVELASAAGRADIALDLIYARRQRGWLEHTGLPDAPATDIVPIFLGTSIYQALVNIPLESRLDGSFFGAALALDPSGLYEIATRAARRRHWGRRPNIPSDWPLLRDVIARFEPGGWLAREVLGEQWWAWATGNAPSEWWVRLLLWRAVGVEALHRWCARQQRLAA